MMSMNPLNLLYVLLVLVGTAAADGSGSSSTTTSWYVKEGARGTMCLYDAPCGSIQLAIDLASDMGDIVYISKGVYVENVAIPPGKNGLTLKRMGGGRVVIESAGGNPGQQAPPGVPVDIVLDIFSPNVSISDLTIRHPHIMMDDGQGLANTKRDVGIFVRPPALDVHLYDVTVERLRMGEPTTPGSRGLLVFRATGTVCEHSDFRGYYEDHIHIPSSQSVIVDNQVQDATRIGIVVIQENESSQSVANLILDNTVKDSGTDGIQIQGDSNIVEDNYVKNSGANGIHICGPGSGCVAPGGSADATNNLVRDNKVQGSALLEILDAGSDNTVESGKGAKKGGKKDSKKDSKKDGKRRHY